MRQMSFIEREEKHFWNDLRSGKFAMMVKEESRGNELNGPHEVYNIMKPIFAKEDDVERLYCIFLDTRNKIISIEKMSTGTLTCSSVYPREIIKMTLKLKAGAVVLTHNHPSNKTDPSNEDKAITLKVGLALAAIDVQLHDHIIVGDGYYSFSGGGIMNAIKDQMNGFLAAVS